MGYAPVEDIDQAAHCATLFSLAGAEVLFDNRGQVAPYCPANSGSIVQ